MLRPSVISVLLCVLLFCARSGFSCGHQLAQEDSAFLIRLIQKAMTNYQLEQVLTKATLRQFLSDHHLASNQPIADAPPSPDQYDHAEHFAREAIAILATQMGRAIQSWMNQSLTATQVTVHYAPLEVFPYHIVFYVQGTMEGKAVPDRTYLICPNFFNFKTFAEDYFARARALSSLWAKEGLSLQPGQKFELKGTDKPPVTLGHLITLPPRYHFLDQAPEPLRTSPPVGAQLQHLAQLIANSTYNFGGITVAISTDGRVFIADAYFTSDDQGPAIRREFADKLMEVGRGKTQPFNPAHIEKEIAALQGLHTKLSKALLLSRGVFSVAAIEQSARTKDGKIHLETLTIPFTSDPTTLKRIARHIDRAAEEDHLPIPGIYFPEGISANELDLFLEQYVYQPEKTRRVSHGQLLKDANLLLVLLLHNVEVLIDAYTLTKERGDRALTPEEYERLIYQTRAGEKRLEYGTPPIANGPSNDFTRTKVNELIPMITALPKTAVPQPILDAVGTLQGAYREINFPSPAFFHATVLRIFEIANHK